MTAPSTTPPARWATGGTPVASAGTVAADTVLLALDTAAGGRSTAQAATRLAAAGPNAVVSRRVHPGTVLIYQLRSALLLPLVATPMVAFFLGDHGTRRVPLFRSRPSLPLILVASVVAAVAGIVLPFSSLSDILGFAALSIGFFAVMATMVIAYLILIEFAKRIFLANPEGRLPPLRRRGPHHHLQRRTARFHHPGPRIPLTAPRSMP